jgi:hypothetical protein
MRATKSHVVLILPSVKCCSWTATRREKGFTPETSIGEGGSGSKAGQKRQRREEGNNDVGLCLNRDRVDRAGADPSH